MSVSVIVPVYNEEHLVQELCRVLSDVTPAQIIIVDGHSSDGSWSRLKQCAPPSFTLIRAPTGRASQMNAGALHANGQILLFLHADTKLPEDAVNTVQKRVSSGAVWGRFDIDFDVTTPILFCVARLMNLRSRATSICTGDQGIFVRREVFFEVGGFAPIPLMEDIDLSRRLKRLSKPASVGDKAITSSRRWRQQGVWRTITNMWLLRLRYWLGVPPSRLSPHYYPGR